jgi:carbonic anhydrase/acetyltransferase-like protein (isoleucine patch superfamily)
MLARVPIYELGGTRPLLGRDVFVADNATVIGDVRLGDESGVWFGVVLRGDYFPITVGARTNIQDNTVVHITADSAATSIGDEVTIGHGAIIHGCTIGHRCLIGMGSIVLDGALVGDGSLIGAGSLVTPGTVIPPRSFALGRPAKVTRPTSDGEVEGIRRSAARYVDYARDYRAAARRVG